MKNNQKKYFMTIIVLCMCLFTIMPVSAANKKLPDGFLIGDEYGINVTKEGAYFFNLENLVPGDVVERSLIIENTKPDEAFEIELTIIPGKHTGAINLLEELTMLITSEGKVLYSGKVSNPNKEVKITLGRVEQKTRRTINIVLQYSEDVEYWAFNSGISTAEVNWNFSAISTQKTTKTNPIASIKTGDSANLYMLIGGLVISGVLLILLIYRYKGTSADEEVDDEKVKKN